MKKILLVAGITSIIAGCRTDATVASYNISRAADMFEVQRRIVFYNGITGDYMLELEGKCSIMDQSRQLVVTCKTSDTVYKKHFLGLSDNVTYFAEQLQTSNVSVYHNRIIWKPQSIIPNIDLEVDIQDMGEALTK